MERLIIKQGKMEVVVEPFDIDNEMPFTINDDGYEEITFYLNVYDVNSIIEYMTKQLTELAKKL
jgi:hypothetical protein